MSNLNLYPVTLLQLCYSLSHRLGQHLPTSTFTIGGIQIKFILLYDSKYLVCGGADGSILFTHELSYHSHPTNLHLLITPVPIYLSPLYDVTIYLGHVGKLGSISMLLCSVSHTVGHQYNYSRISSGIWSYVHSSTFLSSRQHLNLGWRIVPVGYHPLPLAVKT